MDQQKTVVVTAGAALVAVLGGWFALPFLRSSQQAVNDEASLHVERARRLLHQYDPQLAYSGLVRDQLAAAKVDVDLADPAAFAESGAETYEAVHGELWSAFQPTDWGADPPRAASANYGNVASQVRSGIDGANEAVAENIRLLDEALNEVNKALAVTVGGVSARSDLDANQLKAVVLQQKGAAAQSQAALLRADAAGARDALLQLGNQAAALSSSATLVADSGIDPKIDGIRASIEELEDGLNQRRGELKRLEETIAEMEARQSAAETAAEEARVALDRLAQDGLNFSEPNGAEAFRDRMAALNQTYTRQLRLAHMLEQGGYPKAQIDYSGDYLRGRYLENGRPGGLTIDMGLRHYRLDRDVLMGKIEAGQAAVEKLEADAAQMAATREQYASAAAEAAARLAELRPAAALAYAELNRIGSEAGAIEETALKAFDEAVGLLQQAARSADQWIAEGRERAQGVSPEAAERSAFQKRTDDSWLAGEAYAEAGAARLAKAWVYYERYRAAMSDAQALGVVTASLPVEEADAGAEREKAAEAKLAGIDEVKQAVALLEKAHKGLGKHWTAAAQSAGTLYLMVLFGDKDYVADAIEQYRSVVKGREDEPFAEPYVARLTELERIAGSAVPPPEAQP